MPVSKTESTNVTALTAAERRVTGIDSVVSHIDRNLDQRSYSATDRDKFTKLRGDLLKAKEETNAEISARKEVQQAYDASTYSKKDADPEVKAKLGALAKVRKDNKPVMHFSRNMVNEVCIACLDQEVDAIMDCDTPYYVKYGKGGGPQYKNCHVHTLETFAGWDDLIASNTKTLSEKKVLIAMSANEGDLDAVQAYDSEILSLGAMQKTVNPTGQGELPRQLQQFRDDPATRAIFDRELGSKGYSIGPEIIGKQKDGTPQYDDSDTTLYFTDPRDPKATPITGHALDEFIQTHRDRWPDTLGPFRSLGRQPEFQQKQVLDFNHRLLDSIQRKAPKGYQHPIGDYVTSEVGGALVLDQDVNAPNWVSRDFGAALDRFYRNHPKTSKDPTTWTTAERSSYEAEILDNYVAGRRGTNMQDRAAALRNPKAGLSATPGSLTFP